MDILKKSIKAFVICIVLFIMLTALASLLMHTGLLPYTGEFNPVSLINKMNFIPAAAGMMGGIVGSNTKK